MVEKPAGRKMIKMSLSGKVMKQDASKQGLLFKGAAYEI